MSVKCNKRGDRQSVNHHAIVNHQRGQKTYCPAPPQRKYIFIIVFLDHLDQSYFHIEKT